MSSADVLRQLADPAVAQALTDGADALDQHAADVQQHQADLQRIADLEAQLAQYRPKTAWGVNVPRGQLPAMDTLFGGIQAVRFYHPVPAKGKRATVRWPTAAELGGDLGGRLVAYSSKAPPQDVAAGAYDGDYEALCAAAPEDQDTLLAVRHEAEDDIERGQFTPADLRAAWARVSAIIKASGNPRILRAPIIMQWTLDPASKRNYRDFLPAEYDVNGWDFYPTSAASIPAMIGRMRAAAQEQGKPWFVAETGHNGHPELMGPLAAALAAERLPAVLYYNNGRNAATPEQAKAWKAAQTG
jgi:hypothetical protein